MSNKPAPLSEAQRLALECAAGNGDLGWVKPNTRRWLADRELIFARGVNYDEWRISSRGHAALDWGHYGEITMPDGSPVVIPSSTGGRQEFVSIGEAENRYVEVSALIWRDQVKAEAFPADPNPLFAEMHRVLAEVLRRTLRLDLPAFLARYDEAISKACRELHDRMIERGEHPLIPQKNEN